MRRIVVAGHLFTARASSGMWDSRPSCWTEAALPLTRRMLLAGHLFSSRAAPGMWRSPPFCWTEAALRLSKCTSMAGQNVASVKKSRRFCRTGSGNSGAAFCEVSSAAYQKQTASLPFPDLPFLPSKKRAQRVYPLLRPSACQLYAWPPQDTDGLHHLSLTCSNLRKRRVRSFCVILLFSLSASREEGERGRGREHLSPSLSPPLR